MWRAADLGGLELFRATLSEFSFRPHAHEEFFIALTEAGLVTPTYRTTQHVLGAGDLLVLNPEEAHAGGPPAGRSWTYRALYPSRALLRQITAEFPAGTAAVPEFGPDAVRDREVTALLRRFHRLTESPGSSQLDREAHLIRALVLLTGRHARRPAEPRPAGYEPSAVSQAREYLAEHAADNVTLSELARLTGLSPFHLCRVFRQCTGMAPHAYQTQLRVRRARSLLGAGLPIASAAIAAGFYDQAHLTRHFKRVVGVPPGRYLAGPGLGSKGQSRTGSGPKPGTGTSPSPFRKPSR
jgi:AraC-like DNA-binding protein